MRRIVLSIFLFVAILGLGCVGVAVPVSADTQKRLAEADGESECKSNIDFTGEWAVTETTQAIFTGINEYRVRIKRFNSGYKIYRYDTESYFDKVTVSGREITATGEHDEYGLMKLRVILDDTGRSFKGKITYQLYQPPPTVEGRLNKSIFKERQQTVVECLQQRLREARQRIKSIQANQSMGESKLRRLRRQLQKQKAENAALMKRLEDLSKKVNDGRNRISNLPCPNCELVEFLGDIPSEPLMSESGETRVAAVIVNQPEFLTRPVRHTDTAGVAPDYLTPVRIFRLTDDGNYLLVRRAKGTWGWMRREHLLEARSALNATDLKQQDGCKGNYHRRATNGVAGVGYGFARALVGYKSTNGGSGDGRVNIFDGPGMYSYHKTGLLSSGTLAYVYRVCRRNSGDVFILLGNAARWDADYPEQHLLGWVRQEQVIHWETGAAVWYNDANQSDREPTHIFDSEKNVTRYLQTGSTSGVIAGEKQESTMETGSTQMRFLVLADLQNILKIAGIANLPGSRTTLLPGIRRNGVEIISGDKSPLIFEGWVAKKGRNGSPNFQSWVLISRTVADELVGYFSSLRRDLSRNATGIGLAATLSRFILQMTDQDIDEQTNLAKFLEKYFNLPGLFLSTRLNHSLNDIENRYVNNRNFRKNFTDTLCVIYRRLQFMQTSKDGEVMTERGRCRVVQTKERQWWRRSIGTETLAWVPVSYLNNLD